MKMANRIRKRKWTVPDNLLPENVNIFMRDY
jgi:hypothetical protein